MAPLYNKGWTGGLSNCRVSHMLETFLKKEETKEKLCTTVKKVGTEFFSVFAFFVKILAMWRFRGVYQEISLESLGECVYWHNASGIWDMSGIRRDRVCVNI